MKYKPVPCVQRRYAFAPGQLCISSICDAPRSVPSSLYNLLVLIVLDLVRWYVSSVHDFSPHTPVSKPCLHLAMEHAIRNLQETLKKVSNRVNFEMQVWNMLGRLKTQRLSDFCTALHGPEREFRPTSSTLVYAVLPARSPHRR